MLFIRTYVSPAKASEEVALMKAEVVNTKPKTLMRLRIQTLLALSRYSITALINDTERKKKKKKGKKPHGSYSHNMQHVDAGWLSALKYS